MVSTQLWYEMDKGHLLLRDAGQDNCYCRPQYQKYLEFPTYITQVTDRVVKPYNLQTSGEINSLYRTTLST